MAWPSFLLLLAVVAFTLTVLGAIVLQFSRTPPRVAVQAVLAGSLIGLASISVYLVQTPVASETDTRPTIFSVLFP